MSAVTSDSYSLGAVYETEGAFEKAAEHYQSCAHAEGAYWPRVLYRLGLVYSTLKKYQDACCAFVAMDFNQQCATAVTQHSIQTSKYNAGNLTDAAHWWRLGLTYYAECNWTKSADCFQHALYREPDHFSFGQYLLGLALYNAGEAEQACAAFLAICIDRDIFTNPQGMVFDQPSPSVAVSYVHYRNNLAVHRATVVYESYGGVAIRCNPRAIFDQRQHYDNQNDWLHVWVLNDKENIPEDWKHLENVIFIPVDSQRYAQFLATAAYFINNSNASTYLVRRAGQKFLNTWHGTPLKGLGRDIKTEFNEFGPVQYNFLQATHLISPNPHTTQVLLDRYDLRSVYAGRLAETGYPRIDYTVATSIEEQRALRHELGLLDSKPIVLFAPTWRGTFDSMDLDFQRLARDLKAMSHDGVQLVFRGHYFLEEQLSRQRIECTVIPASIDTNILLSIVDILVTDYSSICVDFYPKQKPVIYYAYDQAQYAKERGLYLLPEHMPGVFCSTRAGLVAALNTAVDTVSKAGFDKATESYNLALYNAKDDGRATQRVIDFFFNDDDSTTVHSAQDVDGFYNVLIYPGSMAAGEVTNAALELVHAVNRHTVNPIIVSCPDAVQKNVTSTTLTALFADTVQHIPRVGGMVLTRRELQCLHAIHDRQELELTALEYGVLVGMYSREFSRVFGCAKVDVLIDFIGTDQYWNSLFAFAKGRARLRRVMYLHDELTEPPFKRESLNAIAHIYQQYDVLVSMSARSTYLHQTNLASRLHIAADKFIYAQGLSDQRLYANGYAAEPRRE